MNGPEVLCIILSGMPLHHHRCWTAESGSSRLLCPLLPLPKLTLAIKIIGAAQVEPSVQKLYDYIYERGTIVPVEDYSMELLSQGDISKRVTESIRYAPRHIQI